MASWTAELRETICRRSEVEVGETLLNCSIKFPRNPLLCLSSCIGTQQTEANQDEVFQLVNVLYN